MNFRKMLEAIEAIVSRYYPSATTESGLDVGPLWSEPAGLAEAKEQ